jgi:hexosaminidase
VELLSGAFAVRARTRISVGSSPDGQWIGQYFADLVRRTRGLTLPVDVRTDPSHAAHAIAFVIDPAAGVHAPEAYTLTVLPEGVTVSARDRRGLLYGAVTLWQLMGTGAGQVAEVSVRAQRIVDEPRFTWRGLMLDSARHYQSPEFIERYIDWMALHKLNVLHWHLVDDQAWRLEIKKYPRLTEVGAWRVPAGAAAAADLDPATGKARLYGGFYSQETVRRLVRYARERNVTIVPEIELPGHATAAIVAYPQLGVGPGLPTSVPADWGIYPNLFNVEDATFAFLEDVFREVIELFPGEYVHVGGDEAVKDQWQASPRVHERMKELEIKDEHELQAYFIQRIGRFLSAHGRRLIGWDEILEGGLAPDATVMSWRGVDGALAAAAAGHDAVLAAWPTLYFDNRQGVGTGEPPGRGRVISLEDVYRFEPLPSGLAAERQHHVLGVQANLWTEHVRTEERAEYMTFPRAAAVAEVGWSRREHIDWPDFRRRVQAALAWYGKLGLHYADTAFRAPTTQVAGVNAMRRSQELKPCADKLALSLEDDAPLRGDRAIFLVDIMQPCWIYQGADLTRALSLIASVGQVPFNFQLGKDKEGIKLRAPASPEGELEVRLDSCDGERIATLPLAPAVHNQAVTRLPAAALPIRSGRHDLCLTFTGHSLDPLWAIDSIDLATKEH